MKKRNVAVVSLGILAMGLCGVTANAKNADMVITADTYVADFGQTVRSFTLENVSEEAAKVKAEDFVISNDLVMAVQSTQGTEDVQEVSYENGKLTLTVGEFRYLPSDFVVTYIGDRNINLSFTKEQVDTVHTEIADDFAAYSEDGVNYRLYIPEDVSKPLPMVIWTHGGGEKGTDNWAQIAANRGATAWIEQFGDVVVLAPQASDNWDETIFEKIRSVILTLVEEGVVDAGRVYGSGCSFGGGGCLLNAQYNEDILAAIMPICPSMNDETMAAMKSLTEIGVWASSAFEDTFPTRDDCIYECIQALKEAGNENASYTFYASAEYLPYGLGTATIDSELATEYHHSWVLTLRNEYGIMDWLWRQTK